MLLESLFDNVTGLHAIRLATLLKGTPTLMFTCEFCENFRNTFLWNTFGKLFIPCIYYRISASIYDKKLWLVLFKHFVQERKVAIGRCSFNQNPWKLSLKKVIRNSVEEFQPTSLLKKTLSHTFACIKPSFLRDASRDFFLRTLCKSELNHVIRVVKLVGNSPGSSSLRDIVKLFLINFQIMDRKIGTNFLGP